METSPTTIQIQGPVVVLPLDEYLEQKSQLEEYRQLKAIYERDREDRFRRLLAIAERNRAVPPEQVEADVEAAVRAARDQA
jgi:t-SNARE complex subunit (syntaxin)